jgi:hypothetical protein
VSEETTNLNTPTEPVDTKRHGHDGKRRSKGLDAVSYNLEERCLVVLSAGANEDRRCFTYQHELTEAHSFNHANIQDQPCENETNSTSNEHHRYDREVNLPLYQF